MRRRPASRSPATTSPMRAPTAFIVNPRSRNGNPQGTGVGFFGRGVDVETVRRAYSQFLDNAVLTAQAQGSYLDTYNSQISQIDNLLADPSAGLSPALQAFFSSVQDVASIRARCRRGRR